MASLRDLRDPRTWSHLPMLDTGSQEERGTDVCVCECTRECVGMPMFLCAFCVNECLCACGVFVSLLFSRSDVSDPVDCSTPGLPVHHQLPELAHTHVHGVGDAIQLSHPLSSPSPPALTGVCVRE